MHTHRFRPLAILLLAAAVAACDGRQSSAVAAGDGYEQSVLDWRAGRRERLVDPDGYLTQIGLHWLRPGEYSFGSAAASDIRVPPPAPSRIGTFRVDAEGVSMAVEPAVEVIHDGSPVAGIRMAADTTAAPVMLEHGRFAWSVIERAGRFAVRVRDYQHPFAQSFGALPYFAIDPSWQVEATLMPYDEPQKAWVGTVIEGLPYEPDSPGTVVFERDGRRFELEAYASGDALFFVFGDRSNRDETYPAGRFLYAALPDTEGRVVLDFNLAYSPPCAFNDFSTCPIASPRNRLDIAVTAGEKYDPALRYTPDD